MEGGGVLGGAGLQQVDHRQSLSSLSLTSPLPSAHHVQSLPLNLKKKKHPTPVYAFDFIPLALIHDFASPITF